MSQYLGKQQHGWWWLRTNNQLRYSKATHGLHTEDYFRNSKHIVKWWYIKCELDWYRMMKEYKKLAEGPLEPLVA